MKNTMNLAICTKCDGLGQERWKVTDMIPQSNVAGWHRGPSETGWDCDYYWRICKTCDGEGFRPTGVSVPSVPREAAK